MINKVVFFNFYHNGDIHVSRNFVRKISEICQQRGISCEYFHPNDPGLLADIPYIKHTTNRYGLNDKTQSKICGNVCFINTWYAGTGNIYKNLGITFECIYDSFMQNAKLIDIDLSKFDVIDLFPNINYKLYDIAKAQSWIDNHIKTKVFICNGDSLSGQAINFSFSEIINEVSNRRQDIDFIISHNDDKVSGSNVFFTRDIIQKHGFDLNENTFLASHCPLIIGRMTGVYTFATNRDNYFDNPKTFLAFVQMPMKSIVWIDKIAPKAKIIGYDKTNANDVINIINENLP